METPGLHRGDTKAAASSSPDDWTSILREAQTVAVNLQKKVAFRTEGNGDLKRRVEDPGALRQ